MAGSLQPRIKTWVSTEDVDAADLNAEFDNVLTAMQPLLIDDYSTNTVQMQVTTDPGEVGSESLATTLAGEIARLRFMIAEITGETRWYTSPDASIATLASLLGTGLQNNRISSGRVRATSEQPIFLQPLGSNRTVTVIAANTSFVYYVDGTQVTLSSNVAVTSLTAAPSTNNTASINDPKAADQYWTKYTGEDGSHIPIDGVGSEITSKVGKFAAFALNNGSATEYFTAFVESDRLTKAKRGYFFDSADAPVSRIAYSDNDALTLLQLTWVFAKNDGTLTVTYNNPIWSKDEPASPSSNDYWFDLDNLTWKRYDISSFAAANATLIGVCIQTTAATVGARSFEPFKAFDESNTIEVERTSNTEVKGRWQGAQISVWGETFKNDHNIFVWDITSHLDSGVVEAASTYYYYYVTEDGDVVISDERPYDRREDLKGYYHPYNSWRCVGKAFNNASSNLLNADSYYNKEEKIVVSNVATTNVTVQVVNQVYPINTSAANITATLPPAAYWRGQTFTYIKTTSDFNAVNIVAHTGEYINDAVNTTLNTQFEAVDLLSDGANVYIKNRVIPSYWTNAGVIPVSATTTAPTKGSNIASDVMHWSREGAMIHIRYDYKQNGNTDGAAGVGDYLFGPPSGIVFDTRFVFLNNLGTGSGTQDQPGVVGVAAASHPGTTNGLGVVRPFSATNVKLFAITAASADGKCIGQAAAHYQPTHASGVVWTADYRMPVSGWKG